MNRDSNLSSTWNRPTSAGNRPSIPDERTAIVGGRIVTPEAVYDGGTVVVRGTRIERVSRNVDAPPDAETTIDAAGKVVMPGLVDLHGDDVERHLFPRPEARVDTRSALLTAARANVTSGVTTKFHAIAFEDDPGENRTVDLAHEIATEIERTPGLPGDNRIHARCEVTERIDTVRKLLEGDVPVGMVSLMNHVPGEGQFPDDQAFKRRYTDGHGLTASDAERLLQRRADTTAAGVRERVTTLSAAAREADVPVASHDDATPADVERTAEIGATISEFPVTMAAAERASELGSVTVMGAPNLVRGGSLWDNLAVEDAIEAGAVDVLCSDYHPPSLLRAPFVSTDEPLSTRVARVTANPARSVGLDDRGRLRAGRRADILVVDPEPIPTVERVLVNGQDVFRLDTAT